MGDVRFDDWLLWRDPALQGRIAYDGSYELLTGRAAGSAAEPVLPYGSTWKQFARGYRVLVL